jgi:tRNA A-37 threonylcarbamoyl transferase component Bud32
MCPCSYISEARYRVAEFIHGDPVLSNILLEKSRSGGSNNVKFIDMRGALGNRLTTSGDINYDLSKLYQSLNGYDYMLLDVYSTNSYSQLTSLSKLQEVFWEVTKKKNVTQKKEDIYSSFFTSCLSLSI